MKTLSRYFSMAVAYLKFNIQAGLEYPAYLIGWFLSNPLQFIFGVITIKVVITNFQPLGGWTFGQVVFLYGLGILSHGLSVVFFVQTWNMDRRVTEGGFDRMLVRPLNVFFQFCFDYFNYIGFTDLIPGLIVFGYGCTLVGFSFTVLNIFKILIVVIGGTLLRGGLYIITGSLSFWVQRTGGELVDVQLSLHEATKRFPMSIYPKFLQGIFTFLWPIGFTCFYPASEFLGIETQFVFPGSLCVWAFVVGIAIFLLGITIFNFGLLKYESAGS